MAFLTEAANRGSVPTGYDIENSVKMEPDNGERFDTGDKFTNYSSVRKFTVSAWLKRTELSVQSLIWFNVNTATAVQLQFLADDYLYLTLQDNVGNGLESYAKTSALFRDTSAWYHVILAVDTTQGTAANRTKIYVNGVNETLVQGNASYDTFPAQNYNVPLQTKHYLLGYDGGDNSFRGYAAEYYFLDGITASPTDFGEFDADSGIWKPIEYTGGFGNEGYYLDFEDSSALGKDVSSNNQGNFSHYGGSASDQSVDTPTNNFCTMNPYAPYLSRIIATSDFTNGATQITKTNSNAWCGAIGTMGVKSGKWYYEARVNDNDNLMLGFSTFTGNTGANQSPHTIGTNIVWYGGGASGSYWFYHIDSGSQVSNSSNRGTVWSNGDVLGVALDIDNSRIDFYVNGSLAGSSNTNVDISATVNEIDSTGDFLIPFIAMWRSQFKLNFGGYTTHTISSAASDANGYGTFEYAPPSGYYALCTKNLAEYG